MYETWVPQLNPHKPVLYNCAACVFFFLGLITREKFDEMSQTAAQLGRGLYMHHNDELLKSILNNNNATIEAIGDIGIDSITDKLDQNEGLILIIRNGAKAHIVIIAKNMNDELYYYDPQDGSFIIGEEKIKAAFNNVERMYTAVYHIRPDVTDKLPARSVRKTRWDSWMDDRDLARIFLDPPDLDTRDLDPSALLSESANSEIANSEIANSEIANSEIANSEIANSEIANSEIANSESANVENVDSDKIRLKLNLNPDFVTNKRLRLGGKSRKSKKSKKSKKIEKNRKKSKKSKKSKKIGKNRKKSKKILNILYFLY